MKKQLFGLLLAMFLAVGLLPTVAMAEGLTYWDWDTTTKELVERSYPETYTELTNDNPGSTTWTTGWYVVTENNVTLNDRVTVSGDVHLILANNCNLAANGGIQVQGDWIIPNASSSSSLTIYAQSAGSNMGKLTVPQLTTNDAAIGANGAEELSYAGFITINGGNIDVSGATGAGIGGGGESTGSSGGIITINGGVVQANSSSGAGIGGGKSAITHSGIITINGGSVTASSGSMDDSCAIGGAASSSDTVTINGGTVKATVTGSDASGISVGPGGTITINGGVVEATATGSNGKGIENRGLLQFDSGNAVVFASSIGNPGSKENWNGIVFEGNEGKVYGTSVTPSENFTIPAGKTLTIGAGQTMTIPEGVTLTNNGTVQNEGTILNYGTIVGTVSGNQPKTPVSAVYLDENGREQTAACDATITADNIDTYSTLTAGWYVVKGTITASNRITVNGVVHLILEDDCEFTVNGGIQVQDNDNNPNTPSTNSLTIYAQTTENNMGKLIAQNVGKHDAGIGGNGYNGKDNDGGHGGTVTINGGYIESESHFGAGIGGGSHSDNETGGKGGTITINGGVITITGSSTNRGGAGIGGGFGAYGGSGGNIIITGGTVTINIYDGAGIGGGGGFNIGGDGGNITINGGSIQSGSSAGAGIGGGVGAGTRGGEGGNITITGGSVIATSQENGAGIGGGRSGNRGQGGAGGRIAITGGNVIAISKALDTGELEDGAGIGGGAGMDGGNGGIVDISGGIVTATSQGKGAGIGGGHASGLYGNYAGGNGGSVTITGGTVTATSQGNGEGIGGGSYGNGTNSTADSGTFQTTNGNAVLFANSIGDKSNIDNWTGVIFEGNDGKVYGSSVTPVANFTIDSGKTLLIPQNTALTISITAVNEGCVYVDGTLNGSISNNGGAVYFPLTVNGCTANPINTYNGKTYGKPGETVQLTPGTPPEGYSLGQWKITPDPVAVDANNQFTMPSKALTVTAQWKDSTAPVISGVGNGNIYCLTCTVTVTDNVGVTSVTVDGIPVTIDGNNQFVLSPKDTPQTIVAKDAEGNFSEEMIVTVNSEHKGGTATCVEKATCIHCGTQYGLLDTDKHNLEYIPSKGATVTATGNKEYWHCKDCGKYFSDANGTNSITLSDTAISKLPPSIINGSGQSLTAGEWKELTFRSNAAFADFVRVELDGHTVESSRYTVKEGSTIVSLKADYVRTLSAGEHTLGIVSTNGMATTPFTIHAPAATNNSQASLEGNVSASVNTPSANKNPLGVPPTGDDSPLGLWVVTLIVSGVLLIILGVVIKKRRSKK